MGDCLFIYSYGLNVGVTIESIGMVFSCIIVTYLRGSTLVIVNIIYSGFVTIGNATYNSFIEIVVSVATQNVIAYSNTG